MAGRIYFTCGTTRAGKSTFARRWKFDEPGVNKVVFTTDELRLALHGDRYHHETEELVWALKWRVLKALKEDNDKILICGTHTTPGNIRKIFELDCLAKPIVLVTPRSVCYNRAKESGQTDLIEYGVIDRHFANLEELSGKKYVEGDEATFAEAVVEAIEKIREEYLED